MTAKLLIARAMPDAVVTAARRNFDVTFRNETQPMSVPQAVAALQDYDAIMPTLGDPLTADTFAKAAPVRCKMLANFGVGYNHIDVAAAKAAGITVSNTPGAVTDATADIAMTLILMAARRVSEGEMMVRSGSWKGWEPTQLLGLHVTGKTVGIVGMGRIGKAIAKRCHNGFGMKVRYFNRSLVPDPGVPASQVDDLGQLLGGSDIVVAAVPGGAGTHHLFGASAFQQMRRHAVFVNISRGDVVDEDALIDALQDGQIAGAGLDVYEYEPKVPSALRKLKNVSLLPHLGTAALEVRISMGMMAVENLLAWEKGAPIPNRV